MTVSNIRSFGAISLLAICIMIGVAGEVDADQNTSVMDHGATPTGLLIGKGDSITDDGNQTRVGLAGDASYFNMALPLLRPQLNADNRGWNGTRVGFENEPEGSNNWLHQVQTDIIDLFDDIPDDQPKIVTVMMGNTLHDHNPAPSGDNNAKQYFDAIRRSSNNIKVVLVDSNPRGGGNYESRRNAVEDWGEYGLGIDFDAYISLRDLPNNIGHNSALPTGPEDDQTYFPHNDRIHPTAVWHDIVAREAFAPSLNALLAEFYDDTSAPEPVQMQPANGAKNVLPDIDVLTLRFDEHVKLQETARVRLHDRSGAVIEEFTSGSGLAVHGVDLELRPQSNLTSNETYYVTLSAGALTDVHGNPIEAINSPQAWRFQVLPEPQLNGAALFLEGDSLPTEIADNDAVGYTGSFSIWTEVLVKRQNHHQILAKGTDGFNQRAFEVRGYFGQGWQVRSTFYGAGGGQRQVNPPGNIESNQVHRMLVTYDEPSRLITMCLDDHPCATNTLHQPMTRVPGPLDLTPTPQSDIQRLVIWKRVLTQTEKIWLDNNGQGRTRAEIEAQ